VGSYRQPKHLVKGVSNQLPDTTLHFIGAGLFGCELYIPRHQFPKPKPKFQMKNSTPLNKTQQRLLDLLTAVMSTHRQNPTASFVDLVASFKVDNCLPKQCQDLGLVEKVRGVGYVWRVGNPMDAYNAIIDFRKQRSLQKRGSNQSPQMDFAQLTAPDSQGPDLRALEARIMSLHERIGDLETTLLDAIIELTNQVTKSKS
jgi:hypothetical protein